MALQKARGRRRGVAVGAAAGLVRRRLEVRLVPRRGVPKRVWPAGQRGVSRLAQCGEKPGSSARRGERESGQRTAGVEADAAHAQPVAGGVDARAVLRRAALRVAEALLRLPELVARPAQAHAEEGEARPVQRCVVQRDGGDGERLRRRELPGLWRFRYVEFFGG